MTKNYFLLFFLVCIHLFFLVNLTFTAWPEMLSYPYLRNNGFLIYKDMIHPYPPILTMLLSFTYKIFGYHEVVLKIFTWILILVNDYLIFRILLKLTKKGAIALLGVLFYLLIQPFLEGNQLWFDLAIVPFTLGGTFFLLDKKSPKNLFLAGLLFGLAAFVKQTVGLFLIVVTIYLLIKKVKFKKIFIFLTGPIIVLFTLVIRLITEGALYDFLNWTTIKPFTEWGNFPGYVQMNINKSSFYILFVLLIPLVLLIIKLKKKITTDENFNNLFLVLIISGVLVYPRFSFFHLQLFIAILSILTLYLLNKSEINTKHFLVFLLLPFFIITKPVLNNEWKKETRFWSSSDLKLARSISNETQGTSNVYLLGLSSSHYVFANKVPPKRWGDNFGWYYVNPEVEKEILFRFNLKLPDYIVWKEPTLGNWYDLGVYQPPLISQWIMKNYTKTKQIEQGIWIWERI